MITFFRISIKKTLIKTRTSNLPLTQIIIKMMTGEIKKITIEGVCKVAISKMKNVYKQITIKNKIREEDPEYSMKDLRQTDKIQCSKEAIIANLQITPR